jgi:uncharacterized protein YoxC
MKFLLHIWKKLLGICIILLSIIIVYNEKSATKMILQKTDEKIQTCQREIESLTTQLTVINKHRKKLAENFIEEKTQLTSEIEDLKLTIKTIKNENYQLNDKITKCSNSINDNNENDKKNVIERIPAINNNNDNTNITGEILELKEKNLQQENEIFELKEHLKQRIKSETLLKHSIDQRRPENASNNKTNEIDPLLHPNEEHKGYADGENVHFHRKIPSSADLEFKRSQNGEIKLPQILAPKVLYQKLQEKQKQKNKDGTENEEGELKNDGREEVVDYQSVKKPNKEENDYKEMGE